MGERVFGEPKGHSVTDAHLMSIGLDLNLEFGEPILGLQFLQATMVAIRALPQVPPHSECIRFGKERPVSIE